MRVEARLVARTAGNQVVVDGQMRRQFAGRHHQFVSNDDIRFAVVQDANDAAVLHGPSSQVAHAFARPFAIEIAAFQVRQSRADLQRFGKSRKGSHLIVHELRNVDGNVATIALGPTLLPKVTRHLGNLLNLLI